MVQNVFEDKIVLAGFLSQKFDEPTVLKIQKAMYLLWAFYAGTYGSIDYEDSGEFSTDAKYPVQLFEPDFEAWQYGPVDNTIYAKIKQNDLPTEFKTGEDLLNQSSLGSASQKKNVEIFLINLIDQINQMDDFTLVNRTHQDTSWQDVYQSGMKHIKMNSDTIKQEYKQNLEQKI